MLASRLPYVGASNSSVVVNEEIAKRDDATRLQDQVRFLRIEFSQLSECLTERDERALDTGPQQRIRFIIQERLGRREPLDLLAALEHVPEVLVHPMLHRIGPVSLRSPG